MKEVFKVLEITEDDVFVTAMLKRAVKLHIKVLIGILTGIVKFTSGDEGLKKFNRDLGM